MDPGGLASFWAVSLLLIAVPGADWAFTITAGLRGRPVPAALGLATGYTAMTLAVAGGVGSLVAGSPGVLTALTVAGGAYLTWHGLRTLLPPPPATDGAHLTRWHGFHTTLPPPPAAGGASSGAGAGARATLWQGVGVSGLNPKGLLIFVALLPQFADPGDGWPFPFQLAALGLVFVVTCTAFYLCLGMLARAVRHAQPAAARAVGRLAGAGMVAVGAGLLVERLS